MLFAQNVLDALNFCWGHSLWSKRLKLWYEKRQQMFVQKILLAWFCSKPSQRKSLIETDNSGWWPCILYKYIPIILIIITIILFLLSLSFKWFWLILFSFFYFHHHYNFHYLNHNHYCNHYHFYGYHLIFVNMINIITLSLIASNMQQPFIIWPLGPLGSK